MTRRATAVTLALALAGVTPLAGQGPAEQEASPGRATYERWCAGCHGDAGAGDGEAAGYMLPRPRDFTKGVYQIRTTGSGDLPTDADLLRVMEVGMPGTAMPQWKTRLTDRERRAVVDYLKSFSRFFQGPAPTPLAWGRPPRASAEGLAEGERVFRELECFKCHGQAGRGDGTSAADLSDDDGHPIQAADLTQNWHFNGGGSVEDIYARLRTGLDGTPMPSLSDAMEAGVVSEEQLWRVAQYVRSLSPAQPPRVREVVRAHLVEALPAGPGDSAWASAEPFYIPLVGQIITRPRWFSPSVSGVWVRALHDGERLALHLSWSDRSRSPDPAWQPWLDGVARTVARDDTTALAHGPDRFAVQFPARISDETELPYFLGGSPNRPVHAWRWSSDPDRVAEGSGTGLGRFAPAAGLSRVTQVAQFEAGEWRLQLTRTLIPDDSATAPAFPTGTAIPIAFYAADGSNGEDETRGSISAWYAVYLDVPTPRKVYVQPVLAAVLTAGLGLLVVARARRREDDAGNPQGETS